MKPHEIWGLLAVIFVALGAICGVLKFWLEQKDKEATAAAAAIQKEIDTNALYANLAKETTPTGLVERLNREITARKLDATPIPLPIPIKSGELSGYNAAEAFKRLGDDRLNANQEAARAAAEEINAQKLAVSIDAEFQPQIEALLKLTNNVINKAADDKLVQLAEPLGPVALRSPLMVTTKQAIDNWSLYNEGAPRPEQRIRFAGGTNWIIYGMPGRVKSPKLFDPDNTYPHSVIYPFVRIIQEGKPNRVGDSRMALATLNFDPRTKKVGFQYDARGLQRDIITKDLEVIATEKAGNELVVKSLLVLLTEVAFQEGKR